MSVGDVAAIDDNQDDWMPEPDSTHDDWWRDVLHQSRVIGVVNGKGGVGKTSTAANLAGEFARNGKRVLAVDVDLNGGLGTELGFEYTEVDDKGRGFARAVWEGDRIPRLKGVRENLDVVVGGPQLAVLSALGSAAVDDATALPIKFAKCLSELAPDYDYIFLDSAPGNPVLMDMVLAAARYLIIPTKQDRGSWKGLTLIGPRVKLAREANPDLTFLGVLLFSVDSRSKRVIANTKARLGPEIQDRAPLFTSTIRYSESFAAEARERGQLAHEVVRDVRTALRGVADDYANLYREVKDRVGAHELTLRAAIEAESMGA